MPVMLGYNILRDAIPMREVIDLLERAFAREAAGGAVVSPKYITNFTSGSMRILFAADEQAGYAAMKAYHGVHGKTRYVVTLYSLKDGEVLAFLDGQLITDLRTGACSGVIARKVPLPGPVSLGIIGSGNQARTQLECLASVYTLGEVAVFSPTVANRERYAERMSRALNISVKPVDRIEEAVHGKQVVASASGARTAEPIVRGEWLDQCRLLCAVGNTRKQFRELDDACFERAAMVALDTPHALHEAGELIHATQSRALAETKRTTLGALMTGAVVAPPQGLMVFKSVGSALQDLALAARYHELLGSQPALVRADDVGRLRDRS